MKITPLTIKIGDLIKGYENNDETDDVKGLNGLLNIRPPYQRQYIYKDGRDKAVIKTILNGFPINIFYYAKVGEKYELLDGQQRTMSICEFVANNFSIELNLNNITYSGSFDSLSITQQNKILDYELEIKVFDGNDDEKLAWFQVINTSGLELTKQEMRNAIYNGEWVSATRSKFSKKNGLVDNILGKYLIGDIDRQIYLETCLKWLCDSFEPKIKIEDYMDAHRHSSDISELEIYVRNVANWIETYFPLKKYTKFMKGLEWGVYYNQFKDSVSNPEKLKNDIEKLMKDDEVENKKGIFKYLLDINNPTREKFLSLRTFSDNIKTTIFTEQEGKCGHCGKSFQIEKLEAHHKEPWSQGGKTIPENCILLCKNCHSLETARLLQIN